MLDMLGFDQGYKGDRLLRRLVCLLFLLAPVSAAKGQEAILVSSADAAALVDSIAHAYYQAKFNIYPAYATGKGISAYDSLLSMFDHREVRRFVIKARRLQQDLASLPEDSLDIQTWIDMKALVTDMSTQAFLLDQYGLTRKSPIPYVDACTNGLYYLAIRDGRYYLNPNFGKRLAAFPKVFANARENLTDPIRLHCEVASASARAFLPFLDALRDPSSAAFGHLDAELIEDAYSELEGFADYLESISVGADRDFALGRDNFVTILNGQHLIDETPEEIVAYAERVLRNSKLTMAALEAPPDAPVNVDSALALTEEDILEFYRDEADSAIAFLGRKDLVTLPKNAPVKVAETPGFIKVLVPGYAYEPPGPFDKDQTGMLYVPLPESLDVETKIDYKRSRDYRKLRGIIAHELYPGHHLQLVAANTNPSYARRMQADSFMAEGWALYCEGMMADEGYYGPSGQRRALGGLVFRAARAVVDVKLQMGEFSLEQAADFMVRETGDDRAFLEQEVRRYAVDPTQPMSYLMGKKAIVEIRDRLKSLRGEAFTLKEFHDVLLSCGTIPPYLLRICVAAKATGRK